MHAQSLPDNLSHQATVLDHRYRSAALSPKSVVRSFAVQTSTPNPDGSLIHQVQPGESVWGIAAAYGMKPEELLAINHLPVSVVLWTGDELVIQPSFTPTITPSVTNTPWPSAQPPARSPAPTRTATLMVMPTPTPPIVIFQDGGRHWLGVGMIVICILGLVMVVITAFHRR